MTRTLKQIAAAVLATLTPLAALAHPGHVHLDGSPFHGWSWFEALPLLFVAAVVVAAILRNRR